MGILGKIFTWWDGATIGTMLNSVFTGEHVGTDAQGNKYYRAKKRRAAASARRQPATTKPGPRTPEA